MLLSFEFSNFKSFKDVQLFSMQHRLDAENACSDDTTNGVNKVAAIYGANAAGKTGVLEALEALRCKILDKEGKSVYDDGYDFAGNRDSRLFRVQFITANGNRYEYKIQYNAEYIEHESLLLFASSWPTTIFERAYDEKRAVGVVKKINRKFTKEQKSALPFMVKNSMNRTLLNFFHEAKQDMNASIEDVYDFFEHRIKIRSVVQVELTLRDISVAVQRDKKKQKWLNLLLPAADFGIQDINMQAESVEAKLSDKQLKLISDGFRKAYKEEHPDVTDEELNEKFKIDVPEKMIKVFFKHVVGDKLVDLKPSQESRGTLTAVDFLNQLLDALESGTTFVVDELDCSLHPMLVSQIVRIFNNPDTNPRNAQLIFTTHDLSLLDKSVYGEDILHREEVWFVEKNQYGESTLYPLTQIKNATRKEDNLYKKYIEGRYGAIPKASLENRIEEYWLECDGDKNEL